MGHWRTGQAPDSILKRASSRETEKRESRSSSRVPSFFVRKLFSFFINSPMYLFIMHNIKKSCLISLIRTVDQKSCCISEGAQIHFSRGRSPPRSSGERPAGWDAGTGSAGAGAGAVWVWAFDRLDGAYAWVFVFFFFFSIFASFASSAWSLLVS